MFSKKIIYNISTRSKEVISWYKFFSLYKYKRDIDYIVEKDQKIKVLGIDESKPSIPQWNLDLCNVGKAHTYTKGKGIKVAIFDSGIDYTHKEFNNKDYKQIVQSDNYTSKFNEDLRKDLTDQIQKYKHPHIKLGRQYKDIKENSSFYYNFYDDHRHGSTCAGVLAGQGRELLGVAPEVDLYIYKVVDNKGYGSLSSLAEALDDAIYEGIDIATISLAFKWNSALMEYVADHCNHNNVLVFAASGNNNKEMFLYPAHTTGIIAVGGVDSRGYRWSDGNKIGSNYGSHISICGPASTQPICKRSMSRYTVAQGTSLACPFVAGVAALVKSLNTKLSNNTIMKILKETAINKYNTSYNTKVGYGYVDAYAAVKEASND